MRIRTTHFTSAFLERLAQYFLLIDLLDSFNFLIEGPK